MPPEDISSSPPPPPPPSDDLEQTRVRLLDGEEEDKGGRRHGIGGNLLNSTGCPNENENVVYVAKEDDDGVGGIKQTP